MLILLNGAKALLASYLASNFTLKRKSNNNLSFDQRASFFRQVYDVVVRPMPSKEKRRSYYSPPSIDGERQGAFYINVDDITALKKYETMSLALHESNPGKVLKTLSSLTS